MKIANKFLSSMACASLLAACGGGGGGGSATAPTAIPLVNTTQSAEGLWFGTRTSTTTPSQQIPAYVLIGNSGSNINYFVVYHASGNYDSVAAGTAGASSSTISSGDYASYSLVVGGLTNTGNLSGTLQPKLNLNATITYNSGIPLPDPDTLALTYDTQYETSANLATAAGAYTYHATSSSPVYTFTAGTNGAIAGSVSNGCVFNGQLSVRSANKNLYDLSLTVTSCPGFTASPPLSGLATYVTLPGESVKTLILIATKIEAGSTQVFFAAGKH